MTCRSARSGHDPELHLNDIERIEILNGPQGTLFGPGSLSGAVRIVTNKPDPRAFRRRCDTGRGADRRWRPQRDRRGILNVPLIEGTTGVAGIGLQGCTRAATLTTCLPRAVECQRRDLEQRRMGRGESEHAQHAWAGDAPCCTTSSELGAAVHRLFQQQRYRGSLGRRPEQCRCARLRRCFSPAGGYNYDAVLEAADVKVTSASAI